MDYASESLENQCSVSHSDTRPYRSYMCRRCEVTVNICIKCDRGQIYCKPCKPIAKKIRTNKAQSKYNKTFKGKHARSGQSKRYRIKIKKKQNLKTIEPKFEGDRGSPEEPSSGTPISQPMLAEKKGKSDEKKEESFTKYQTKETLVVCHCCGGVCAPFMRRGPWTRKKSLFWFKKYTLRHRGGDP